MAHWAAEGERQVEGKEVDNLEVDGNVNRLGPLSWSSVGRYDDNDSRVHAYFEKLTLESWLQENGFKMFGSPLRNILEISSLSQISLLSNADIVDFVNEMQHGMSDSNINESDSQIKNLKLRTKFKLQFSHLVKKYSIYCNNKWNQKSNKHSNNSFHYQKLLQVKQKIGDMIKDNVSHEYETNIQQQSLISSLNGVFNNPKYQTINQSIKKQLSDMLKQFEDIDDRISNDHKSNDNNDNDNMVKYDKEIVQTMIRFDSLNKIIINYQQSMNSLNNQFQILLTQQLNQIMTLLHNREQQLQQMEQVHHFQQSKMLESNHRRGQKMAQRFGQFPMQQLLEAQLMQQLTGQFMPLSHLQLPPQPELPQAQMQAQLEAQLQAQMQAHAIRQQQVHAQAQAAAAANTQARLGSQQSAAKYPHESQQCTKTTNGFVYE